jgi:hypothetical protein
MSALFARKKYVMSVTFVLFVSYRHDILLTCKQYKHDRHDILLTYKQYRHDILLTCKQYRHDSLQCRIMSCL